MQHHESAVRAFVQQVSRDPENLAAIVTGSVARGTERADSDVDLFLVVTGEAFAEARAAHRIMYTSTDGIGYEGGYFDVKLASIPYLDAAAARADDATRASFEHCTIAWSRIGDLSDRIEKITSPPENLWRSHEASFVAQARLHGEYFLFGALRSSNRFLIASAAVHLANAACRALLARNRVLFQGPKYLESTVATLASSPAGFSEAIAELLVAPSEAAGTNVLRLLESAGHWPISPDETLSLFVEDNELAWLDRELPPEYR